MLQLDDFLLDLLGRLREDNVVMANVRRLAMLAEERFIQNAAEFYLSVFVLLAVEFLGVVVEVCQLVNDHLLLLLLLKSRLELLENMELFLVLRAKRIGLGREQDR